VNIDLPIIFTVLMGAAILAYVVLDGYDLGVGMLMPAASRDEQNRMVASIGPFWDANETWLVLGIGLLLVGFPAAHGEILGALYLPVAAMLVGLMLRGVAFELRIKAEGWHRELWNWLFWAGSTPKWGLLWVALGVGLVSLGTPLVSETVRDKWFDFPRTLALMILPISTLFVWLWVWFALGRSDWKPFAGAVAIYVLAFLGLAYSLFPFVIIDRMTIWEAAAHPSALVFMLVGTCIVLPFIIGYTFYAYRVFRGKVTGGDPYL
jgi:cytochrome bd ubiquinol oxidase subunit II